MPDGGFYKQAVFPAVPFNRGLFMCILSVSLLYSNVLTTSVVKGQRDTPLLPFYLSLSAYFLK